MKFSGISLIKNWIINLNTINNKTITKKLCNYSVKVAFVYKLSRVKENIAALQNIVKTKINSRIVIQIPIFADGAGMGLFKK